MSRLPARRGPVVRLAMVGVAFTLLVAAWLPSNVPFSAPDEASHYLRALGIANGQLLGKKAPYPDPGLTKQQDKFIGYDTTLVKVRAAERPPDAGCPGGGSLTKPVCLEPVPNGNFPPFPYLVPALTFKVWHHTSSLQWATRVASALPSLAFLLVALILLWDGTGLSVLGLLASISPMVVFCSSIMNSSGPGLTSAIALGAAAFRVARDGPRSPRWVFVALGITGFSAIVSGPIGLVFAAVFLIVALFLLGWRQLVAIWNQRRHDAIGVMIALAAGAILWEIWRHISGTAPGLFGISPLGKNLKGGLDQMPQVMESAIGYYGSLTIPMQLEAYRIAWVFEGLLVVAALALARYRDRILFIVIGLLAGAFPILFWAFIDRLTGFGLQGREILPVLMLIPLLAGELLYRSERSWVRGTAGRWLVSMAIAAIALFQGYSWYWNARYNSGGGAFRHFWVHATYQPPGGWWPWLIIAFIGTVIFVLFGLSEAPLASLRRSQDRELPQPA